MRTRSLSFALVLAALLAWSAGGCEREQAPPSGPPRGTGVADDTAQQQQPRVVEVQLGDFTIDMPATLPPGRTTLRVTNVGAVPHNLAIEGQGLRRAFEQPLGPGQTKTMQVDLAPGQYRTWCPVGDHAQRGMEGSFTVAPPRDEPPPQNPQR